MRIIRPGSALLSAALVLLSCSDPSAPRVPASISVVSGDGQSGQVTESLALPVVVEVEDADGRPVSGTTVTWRVTAGGGSVNAGTSSTNGSGQAQVLWTLGNESGLNRLSAEVTGVAPRSITATARGGAPASATVTAGDGQTGLEMQPLGDAIVVEVLDEYGNGVPDMDVTFTPSAGVVTPQVVATDASGIAAAIWTLGPAGQQSVAITTEGLSQPPLAVTATAHAATHVTELQNDAPQAGISAAKGENRYYRIAVPADVTSLTVSTTGGPGDADLYVRRGQLPTTTMSDCDSTSPTTSESCTVDLPASGTWYVLLDAWSTYSDVTIRATYMIGGTMVVNVTGLPQGTSADLVIRGPDRYEKRVTATTTLAALVPGDYDVTANFVRQNDTVYLSSPEEQNVTVELGAEANVSVAYAQAAGALNLDIVGAYITQSVQRPDGSVPLVADRDGLLRVFARGNAASTEMPRVRARFYRNGALVQTMTIPAPSAALPVSHDERSLTSTWNVQVPGSLLQPGTELLVDVDPDNEVVESDESDNTFPATGTPAGLDVRTEPPLLARLVPVVQTNGEQGDVTAANRDTYVTDAQALYPLPSIDVDVRAPYSFDGTLSSSYDSTWQRLLREINALRLAEAPERYYYGVIKPAYQNGGTGLGYIRQPAAVGVDWAPYRASTLAHEWGHNFGRFHV
ncbi:MAG TPA: pre-peptidase C-terminal domain-containing protein, partial [Longimicrobiales bacterium]|nr:pre-peptidase C-terminal domain-containing protein [Longimicrobiales bacterium]